MKYYIISIVVYLISKLPFFVLYAISDFFYLIAYKGLKYRVKVVQENLKKSFPDKSSQEILVIEKEFYSHLCDVLVETVKLATISIKELKKRVIIENIDEINKNCIPDKQMIVMLGHQGNWEWAFPAWYSRVDMELNAVYHPLSDKAVDKLVSRIRTRFGPGVVPMSQTIRKMVQSANTSSAMALISDQTPSNKNNTWLDFLNQETLVFDGPEKMSRKFNTQVYYCGIKKVKRGYYKIVPYLLTNDGSLLKEGELTSLFFSHLEADIKQQPAYWLWSHRRWKHKRE